MGERKKRVCPCWIPTSSSSSRILWFMLPLIVVSVFVGLLGSKPSSKWGFASQNYPWAWNSFITSYSGNGIMSSDAVQGPVSPPKDTEANLDLRPRTVGGGDNREKSLSDDYNLNRSCSPPLSVEAVHVQQPVGNTKESFNITTNIPHVFPSWNETHALPLSGRLERKHSNLLRLEAGLGRARGAIREAKNGNQTHDPDYIPTGPMYWNAKAFHRSYLEMEKQFKIFVYEEGEPPIFHNGPCKSIYAMEGSFIYHMETTQFRTRDPDKAHVYFLPISVTSIVHFIYERNHDWHPMKETVRDYVNLLAVKYPYWNRSLGADHFMLACHDWGPELSSSVPNLYKNSIRALCNANTSEGFKPSKDVSFPEILLPAGTIEGLIGGPSPSRRPYLVFFAGGLHGPIRPILLEHWENKDEEVQVHKYLPKGVSYYGMLRKSKYCICASGYEVASPRMVEALYTGCVPVLIKDHYVPPFSDVLNWKSFSVEVPVKEIPNLKKILSAISPRQYIRMQRRGTQTRRHFEVSLPPKRYDVFHMILHSVWLRRLNIRIHGIDES
ncbi:unnamed protein product [Ilex paraguariensis]|uniref:Exostosin GT47 domain-containing protein n=1 Tax=Ilex paraguariensis TaxID=185542 RepID=A0ABC8STN9_9AQUA